MWTVSPRCNSSHLKTRNNSKCISLSQGSQLAGFEIFLTAGILPQVKIKKIVKLRGYYRRLKSRKFSNSGNIQTAPQVEFKKISKLRGITAVWILQKFYSCGESPHFEIFKARQKISRAWQKILKNFKVRQYSSPLKSQQSKTVNRE